MTRPNATYRPQPAVARTFPGACVPATGGGYVVTDSGATYPRADVAGIVTVDGQGGVDLLMTDVSGEVGGTFTPAAARELAAALIEAANLAEAAQP